MNRKKSWKPVIDKFHAKLTGWKSKTLSFGGRLTLAKSVLGSLPTFFLSIFAAPIGVLNELEKIRRNFLWGGADRNKKINWVSWEKVIAPKAAGGLGLGSIKALNMSLLANWRWKFKTQHDTFWVSIIKGLHNSGDHNSLVWATKGLPGTWGNIVKNKARMANFSIDETEIIRLKDDGSGWDSNFVIDGKFCVNLLRQRIDRAPHVICDGYFSWDKWIPLKVLCFVWRARHDRIPSAKALALRGVPSICTNCSSCIDGEETADHVLVRCPFTWMIWRDVLNWCGISGADLERVVDVVEFAAKWGNGVKKRRKIITSIFYGTLWCVWRARNERLFNTKRCFPAMVVDWIKSMIFVWIKHRGRIGNLVWEKWLLSPFT